MKAGRQGFIQGLISIKGVFWLYKMITNKQAFSMKFLSVSRSKVAKFCGLVNLPGWHCP